MRRHAVTCSSLYIPVHPSVMRPSERDARHLGNEEPGAAERPAPEVDEVKIAGGPVDRRVHVHGRDDDAVLERHAAQAKGREHGRWWRVAVNVRGAVGRRATCEPPLDAREIRAIAEAQILVAHALAAREQRVGELRRIEVDVATHVLEPLHRVPRGVLEPKRLRHALVLVALERRGAPRDIVLVHGARQRDRVLERQLRPGPDREMRGVRGIANEHDVLVIPRGVADANEREPGPVPLMPRVMHQAVAPQPWREHRFAGREGRVHIRAVEPGVPPRALVALDDEGGLCLVEPIGVRLEDARVVHDEDEREGVEALRRAEPNVARLAHIEVGPEVRGELLADGAVDAVRRHDEVGVAEAEALEVSQAAALPGGSGGGRRAPARDVGESREVGAARSR